MTTRDTIKKLMSQHTTNGGLICSQSLCGVGGVQNTISLDDKTGLIEFSISDSSNPAIAVGMALSKPTIYIVRFSGFGWLNFWPICNYAAKCKELWGYSCKLLVRCMVAENQIGPVASNSNHSIVCHMPGIRVVSPLTSNEWEEIWEVYQRSDGPILVSESRKGYDINYETPNLLSHYSSDITLLGISNARLECIKAKDILEQQGYKVNIGHIINLKPLEISIDILESICETNLVVIVDGDYETCGISEHIAYQIYKNERLSADIRVLGLEDRTAGFAKHCDNITPTAEKIVNFAKKYLNE